MRERGVIKEEVDDLGLSLVVARDLAQRCILEVLLDIRDLLDLGKTINEN